jgi:hypothetical protein
MITRSPHRPIVARLFCAVVTLAALTAATNAPGRTALRPGTVPGVTYMIHYLVPNTTTSIDTGGGHVVEVPWEWTGRVVWANGRGRMDVIDGGYPGNFGFFIAKGDYVLFDSTDFVVVQPRMSRFFTVAPIDLLVRALLASGTPDTAGQFGGLIVSLDSLASTDVVAGRPTKHYQVKALYTHVRHEEARAPEPFATTVITDYWLADARDLPPNPFMQFAQIDFGTVGAWSASPSSFQEQLLAKTAVAARMLPPGRVVLKASYVELEVGQLAAIHAAGKTLRHEDRSIGDQSLIEINHIAQANVDLATLVLPDNLSETDSYRDDLKAQFPDDSRLAAPPSIAKWRAMPGGG